VGANPVDRGKPGSKLHLVCDGGGLPLSAVVTAANVSDTTMFQAVLGDVPAVLTPSGRRRYRPGKLHGDKGYDSAANPHGCGVGGLDRGSPGVGCSRRHGLGGTAGRSSERCRG
jgi:Transposase DDE domain